MGLWHVFYADWQMECCGKPFSVGDEVSWPLLLVDADDVFGDGRRDRLSTVVGGVEHVGGVRVLCEDSGLTVALHEHPVDIVAEEDLGEARPGHRVRSVGVLSVERHAGKWPEVTGRVRAVEVLTQGYVETAPGSRSWEPVPGELWLRSVERCPKWFAAGAVGVGADGRGRRRDEAGVVVTLEVPGGDRPSAG